MLKDRIRMLSVCLAALAFCGLLAATSAVGQEPTPGFNSRWRNSDGSPRLMLEFAGGYDRVAGGTRDWQTPGWNLRLGGGYRLNRRLGALVEYGYDHFYVPGYAIEAVFPSQNSPPDDITGQVHLWSLGIEPELQLAHTERYGVYVLGGAGFYRKITSFQDPTAAFLSALDGRNYLVQTNNALGANGGAGVARRIADGSNAKFFVQARYLWVDNSQNANNIYLPAFYKTAYSPFTAGVSW